jgi:hypothetical protein
MILGPLIAKFRCWGTTIKAFGRNRCGPNENYENACLSERDVNEILLESEEANGEEQ